jgi:RimJ/RimL family protein N-acetyltransferase
VLQGQRVVPRAIQREDLGRLWELSEDLELVSLVSPLPPFPTSRAALEAEFEKTASDPPRDRVWFAIEVDGEVIGRCGLHRVDHYTGVCKLGIWIGRDWWGKGYGQDAVRTLVAYAFRHVNMRKVRLEVLARRRAGRRRLPEGRVRRRGPAPAAGLAGRQVQGHARHGHPPGRVGPGSPPDQGLRGPPVQHAL